MTGRLRTALVGSVAIYLCIMPAVWLLGGVSWRAGLAGALLFLAMRLVAYQVQSEVVEDHGRQREKALEGSHQAGSSPVDIRRFQ